MDGKQATNRRDGASSLGNPGGLEENNGLPEWKPDLDCYAELRALDFVSGEEIDRAIELLWSKELRSLPHDLAGGKTIIVPVEAVEYCKSAGMQFKESDVLSTTELPAEELAELRREQGPF